MLPGDSDTLNLGKYATQQYFSNLLEMQILIPGCGLGAQTAFLTSSQMFPVLSVDYTFSARAMVKREQDSASKDPSLNPDD